LSLAVLSRFVSWCFLTQMFDIPVSIRKEDRFTFMDFLKRIKESNFTKFVVFVACMQFAVNIAAPFFAVFMLRDLSFNYLTYALLIITVSLVQIFTIDRWGRHADRVGNIQVIKLTSCFIVFLPMAWIICRNPVYLVLIQIIAGFAWSGFNLSIINFIFDAVRPEKRTRCYAYFSFSSGIAICLGALFGGYLVNILPRLLGYRALSLFLISGLLRLIIIVVFWRLINEVRKTTQNVSHKDLFFSVIGVSSMPEIKE